MERGGARRVERGARGNRQTQAARPDGFSGSKPAPCQKLCFPRFFLVACSLLMSKSDSLIASLISTIVCLAIFLGLFFGLNYPEIIINRDYVSANCHIDSTAITTYYCPDLQTNGCVNAPPLSPACGDLEADWSSINPSTCGAGNGSGGSGGGGSGPSVSCAVTTECDNGYYCCSECCTRTCQTCTQTNCDQNGNNCDTECTNYCCQYDCCTWVDHQDATLFANICYKAKLFLTYTEQDGDPYSTTFTFDTKGDETEAIDLVTQQYQQNSTHPCFYDTRNLNNVLWSIAYNVGYWVATGFFTAFLFGSLVWLSVSLALECGEYAGRVEAVIVVILWFWFSLVLSLCLMLPLLTNPHISSAGKNALYPVFLTWLLFTTALAGAWFLWRGQTALKRGLKQTSNMCCGCLELLCCDPCRTTTRYFQRKVDMLEATVKSKTDHRRIKSESQETREMVWVTQSFETTAPPKYTVEPNAPPPAYEDA